MPPGSSTARCPGPECARSTSCSAWSGATALSASTTPADAPSPSTWSTSSASAACSNVLSRPPAARSWSGPSASSSSASPAPTPSSNSPRRSTAMTDASISPELRQTLRRLKLGPLLETLPERLTLARRRPSVLMFRTERLLKRLKASRLDASYDTELRRLLNVDLLILDDFALQGYDHQETQDLYEIVVERHRRASMVVVSNREPKE